VGPVLKIGPTLFPHKSGTFVDHVEQFRDLLAWLCAAEIGVQRLAHPLVPELVSDLPNGQPTVIEQRRRSAKAITEASDVPSGKSAYCSTSSAMRS
jgi:hypothetical protein